MKKRDFFILSLLLTSGFTSCHQDLEEDDIHNSSSVITLTEGNKEQSMQVFADILSKASYANKDVRAFLKEQALQCIDNDYNVFYPLIKDKIIEDSTTFRQALLQFTDEKKLAQIEANVPLLNIHLPNFTGEGIHALDVSDQEIPVLFNRVLYVNGECVDKLPENVLPAYHTFVVTESNSIRINNSITRSPSSIQGSRYEYVADCFNPTFKKKENIITRQGVNPEYDIPNDKYDDVGTLSYSDLDEELISATRKTKSNFRMTRSVMYYGLQSIDDVPKVLNTNVRDCILRFKIAPNAFPELERIATGDYPEFSAQRKSLFNTTHTSQTKYGLSRDEILGRMLTGRSFCFMFQLEGQVNGNIVRSEEVKVYARPDQLFNLRISWSKRHKTLFRRSKYYYDLVVKDAKPKWFYPLEHAHDTRLNKWDITSDPITKRVKAFLINPDEGATETRKEEYEITLTTKSNVGVNVGVDIDSVVKLGANGELGQSNVERRLISTEYTIKKNNMFIDEFYFNFFDDYPIEEIDETKRKVIIARKGKGILEMSILPITNSYYNLKRFGK